MGPLNLHLKAIEKEKSETQRTGNIWHTIADLKMEGTTYMAKNIVNSWSWEWPVNKEIRTLVLQTQETELFQQEGAFRWGFNLINNWSSVL